MTFVAAAAPCSVYAASNYSMRKKVISTAGIVETGSQESAPVTRGEFARMLVMASVYHDSVGEEGNLPLYADVLADHPYCGYIRIAAEQGWMTAYLGGRFKPDEPVKLLDAARASLRLLGYTDADLAGTNVYSRMAKFNSLELNDEIGKNSTDILTVSDCVNLFYNLLNTNTKENENKKKSSTTIYGAALGYEVSEDGELNPFSMLEEDLKGPYVLKKGARVHSIIPFSANQASYYLDGQTSTKDDIEEAADSEDAVVIYYNKTTKMVYAYSSAGSVDSEGEAVMGAAKGELNAIYYSSANVMTPTSIELDGTEYFITSTDMQYAFSVYGSVEVDDEITIVWEYQTVNGEKQPCVIAVID